MKNFVMYIRVSTTQQDESALGLKSQHGAVTSYINSVGGVLLKEFKEVQSAAKKERVSFGQDVNLYSLLSNRPLLLEALDYAKKNNAILIVKEVLRLTRISLVYEYLNASGVRFLCSDYPNDDNFMLGLRVKFGEQEALDISRRTKLALAKSTKKKENPVRYREVAQKNRLLINEGVRLSCIARKVADNPNNKRASGYISTLREKEGLTYQQIADKLNAEGFNTAKGSIFHKVSVKRIYDRVSLQVAA